MMSEHRPTLLDGLSKDDLASLSDLSTQTLKLEASRLALDAKRLQAEAFGTSNSPALDKAAAELAAGEKTLKSNLADTPHLAKPLAHIRELAKRPYDPAALAELRELQATFTREVAPRDADTSLMEQKAKTPPSKAPGAFANEMVGGGLAAGLSTRYDPQAVPDDVAERYQVRGGQFHHVRNPRQVAFVDHGSKLQTNKSFDGEAIKSMVAIAAARGWDSIKVTGDEAFRRSIWFEAATCGIEVRGYNPTESEKKAAASAAERSGRLNRIESNPASNAYLGTTDAASRMSAAKAHPELKSAFALEAALTKFAEQRLGPHEREAFVAHQRRNIAKDLAQGKPLPAVSMRQPQRKRERETQAEH